MTPALSFTVRRAEPVLVTPASPTPHELKLLSDIDDQDGNRYNGHAVNFYPHHPSNSNLDPATVVTVVRDALAKTLVFFYPLAGRLIELPGRKLAVDCTSEGALFVSATADVSLADFGPNPRPPFPCMDELIHEPDGTGGLRNTPLILIQVTRLKCGGFVLALRLNHAVCDAQGTVQLLHALGEIARGAEAPQVIPVWERHLFSARDPPQITCLHPEYEETVAEHDRAEVATGENEEELQYRSFFFGPREIAALKAHMPQGLRTCSRFDVVTAAVWRSRTAALRIQDGEVRVMFVVSARGKRRLPEGYYGNSFGITVARTSATELRRSSLPYAVELVRKAKAAVTEEHMQSVADLMVLRGRPYFSVANTYVVSDVSRAGFEEVDMGWGKGVYGGPTKGGAVPRGSSFFLRHSNEKGEEGLLVPMCLPAPAMERFEAGVKSLVTLSPA